MTKQQTKALCDALFWIRVANIARPLSRLCLWAWLGWCCLSCTAVPRREVRRG